MAKRKTNAPNLPAQALARARAEIDGASATFVDARIPVNGAEAALARPAVTVKPSSKAFYKAVSVEDLKNEYVYVISDIRNMALLAGLLFVAMVVVAVLTI
jgi:hypothetical protein